MACCDRNATDFSEDRGDWSKDQWRRHALKLEAELREISQPFTFRFTFEDDEKIWDRDVVIARSDDWDRIKERRRHLESWASLSHGPLIVAMGPRDVVCQLD